MIDLSKTVLFHGCTQQEIESLLECMSARTVEFSKGSYIHRVGDRVSSIGLVLSGSVYIENDDVWGNKSILDTVQPGQVFAESYACTPGAVLMINVVAAENCRVLFMDVGRMLNVCGNSCRFHSRLIRNLLETASRKNLNLSWRIFHTGAKTIRGRLLSYLSYQASGQGKREFDIPFNRQQLADYLSVDRSALSAELGKMRSEGLLDFHKNHFVLKVSEQDG